MTLFERLIAGEFATTFLYEDDRVVAFHDIHPVAPCHVLVVPREPLPGIAAMTAAHQPLIGHLLWVATEVARQLGVEESGYRLVINHGDEGGQTVPHLHVHLLASRPMGWPPG